MEEEEEEKSGGESEEKNVIVRHVPLARPHLTPALQHCPRLGEGRRGAGGPHTAVLLAAGSTHLVHHIDSRYISQRCGRHPSLFCGGAHPLEPGSPNSRAVLGMRRGSRRVSTGTHEADSVLTDAPLALSAATPTAATEIEREK